MTKAKMVPFIIIGFLAVLGVIFVLSHRAVHSGTIAVEGKPSDTPATASGPLRSYPMTQVAVHNGPTDCWTVIDGGVYDLTRLIAAHTSGSNVFAALCGIDGTSAFASAHTKVSIAPFKVGTLVAGK